MSERYSTETHIRVYNDDHGFYWNIGPDSDALGCVEVTYHEGGSKEEARHCFTVPTQVARMIAGALTTAADHIDAGTDNG